MNALGILFASDVKAEIVRLLFQPAAEPIYLRELARRSKRSFSTVQRELKKLRQAGVVSERQDGNRTYVYANREHPFYNDLVSLVRKSSGRTAGDRLEFGHERDYRNPRH